jgi:sugar phosphate isomerase/epimerase
MDNSKLGFSTACLANHSMEDALRVGGELGFETVELLAFDGYRHSQGDLAGFYFDRMSDADREALRRAVARFKHVSTHAPFIDIPLLAPNPGVREEALRQIEVAIAATAFLGGSTTTAHACAKQGRSLEEAWGDLVETFRLVGNRASEAGITLTVETGYPVGVETFARLIHDIDHPAVGANVDVGHLVGYLPAEVRGTEEGAALYRATLMDQLDALGEKVYHFHLHDVRQSDFRDHRAAGRGFLDFEAITRWCRNRRYEGLWVFELEEPDKVEALRQSRQHLQTSLGRASERP